MTVADNASLDDIAATLAELRQAGAHQDDPVRFHFLETLCRRTRGQSAAVAAPLTEKLRQALAAYQQQRQAPQQQPVAPAKTEQTNSGLADLLQALSAQPDMATLPDNSVDSAVTATGAPAVELKSVRYFRDTWAKLGVEQRVTQSFAKAPENAGPLNSHLLVLQALGRMRDEAPAYLQHFIAYADSLLWLQQAVNSLPLNKPMSEGTGGGKKRKAVKSNAR